MEQRKFASFLWIYWVGGAVVVVALAVGAFLGISARSDHDMVMAGIACVMLGAGGAGLLGLIGTLPIAFAIDDARRNALAHQEQLLSNLTERLQQMSVMLNVVTENQLISDRAKTVAFREKDRDTIRRAVREEIGRQDWEAALALSNEMDNVFGYKAEADRFRDEIKTKRHEVVTRQIGEQMAAVDKHTNAESWGQAFQEAQRIMAMYPNEPAVMRLPEEIESRRQARKKQLLDQWHDAVAKHDVDESIEILKHLDLYLTPAEAENMQETARSVFKEKIVLLRTQFALAVQDRRWAEAIKLGDTIMTEFPNSRMAQEVREKMDMLRQRAGEGVKA